MKRLSRMLLSLAVLAIAPLLFTGCAGVGNAIDQAEHAIATVDQKLGDYVAKADAAIAKVEAVASVAVKTATDAKAAVDTKIDAARAELAAKGAPVDGSTADIAHWAAQNPGSAAGSLGALATLLGTLAVGYRTAKQKADAAQAIANDHAANLDTIAHNVSILPAETAATVLRGTPGAAGSGLVP